MARCCCSDLGLEEEPAILVLHNIACQDDQLIFLSDFEKLLASCSVVLAEFDETARRAGAIRCDKFRS